MKICVDGLGVSKLSGTGCYSYTYGLLSKLLEIYPQPQYDLIWDSEFRIPEWEKHKNLIYQDLKINRKENDYKNLEDYLKNSKTDVYFSPNNGLSIPQNKVCHTIMTVHDLLPVSQKDLVDDKYYQKFMALFPNAIQKSDKIIAVSHFIKHELMAYYNVPDTKIEVIYPGISPMFKPLNRDFATVSLKNRYSIGENFILYAGSIHPRKNLEVLIHVFDFLLKDMDDMQLVIVGSIDAKREEHYLTLKNLAEKLGIGNRVIFTGKVDYTDMPYFYNGARCFVNLSSYEGFPHTSVEASACNCPVVSLRNSSFSGVDIPHAFLLDTLDVNLLKNVIGNIMREKETRNDLQKPFLGKKSKYSWDSVTNKMVHLIESTVFPS